MHNNLPYDLYLFSFSRGGSFFNPSSWYEKPMTKLIKWKVTKEVLFIKKNKNSIRWLEIGITTYGISPQNIADCQDTLWELSDNSSELRIYPYYADSFIYLDPLEPKCNVFK